jgi:hypothetical protein
VRFGDGEWVDSDAGPVVRAYALTGGRTRPSGERIDLIDMVLTVRTASQNLSLSPEQAKVLARCLIPVPLVELVAGLNLPIGVVRILVSDLRDRGLVVIRRSKPAAERDLKILRNVADGLRRL